MSQNRQLAAIMFTDIEGYTSIMQQDEKSAIAFRKSHREIFDVKTNKFNGKIVQYFGDGTLSIFKSSVEAVQCATEMQLAFLKEDLPIRIGIHVGDIVYSEDDIIGDAVNIASRIESCALPGSILISDKVHDQIRSHRDIEVKFLDAYEFKNVDVAMPLFTISNKGLVVPKPEDIKGKLKEPVPKKRFRLNLKRLVAALALLLGILALLWYFGIFTAKVAIYDNSIAVLPFDNLSVDDDAEIFRDGMTEDILTQLSKLKELHVISRTSVMQYKGTEKTVPEIAEELGVTYILEGSIQKYGDKVRVTAQLINAKTDKHIWADNYDRTLTDIFGIQSEVSREIVDALELELTFDEIQGLAVVPTENIEAYKLFLTGRKEADKRNQESIARSIELYEQAIELDPKYAEAYAEIAHSIYLETYYSGRGVGEAVKLANEYLDKAEAITDNVSRVYSVRGLIYNIEGKRDEAKAAFEKAIKLSPNDLTARHQFSTFYYYTRQFKKQLEQAEIAYKLDPLSFATANSYVTALITNQQYDEAEKIMKNVEKSGIGNNEVVINRTYFRLYVDKRDFKSAIPHIKKIVDEEPVFNRFLGYCYGRIGDTVNALKTIETIRNLPPNDFNNQQLAVVFSGIQETDSVLYYLDSVRNKQSPTILRERTEFFEYLNDDPRFIKLMEAHGYKGD